MKRLNQKFSDTVYQLPEMSPDYENEIYDLVKAGKIPQYNVILLDDNEHTYEYVIEMLHQLFGHNYSVAYEMACMVDSSGEVIVETTSKERAELKQEQIHSFGPDHRLPHSRGSMSAIIEPVATSD